MTSSELTILRQIVLQPRHQVTKKTQHFHGTDELPAPTILKVVKYADDEGFYLFYCDESGAEFTDTYHESLDEALAQADWEFGVKSHEWEVKG